MKICQNCHSVADDDAKFCVNCGGSVFVAPGQPEGYSYGAAGQAAGQPAQQAGAYGPAQQNAGGYGQGYGQSAQNMGGYAQSYGQPAQQAGVYSQPYGMQGAAVRQPKKSKAPVIVAVVAGVFVLGVIMLFVLGVIFGEDSSKTSESPDSDTMESILADLPSVDEDDAAEKEKPDGKQVYEAGVFENGVYENKWANLRMVLPEGWAEAMPSAYETFEDDETYCDFYAVSENHEMFAVVVLDLSDHWDANLYSESDYLTEFIDGIAEELNMNGKPEQFKVSVAGTDYLSSDIYGESEGVTMCITCSLHRIGDYIVLIDCTSQDAETNHNLLRMFEAAQ